MNTIALETLPTFSFAHIHSAEQYHHQIPVNPRRIEISYLAEGSLVISQGKQQFLAEKGDILCTNLFPVTLDTDTFHCHHTTSALVNWTEAPGFHHLLLPAVTKASPQTAEIRDHIDELIYNGHIYEASPEKAASIFLNILCKIDECNRNSEHMQTPPGYILVQRAKKYIHRNITRPLTQTEIAEYLGVTPSYLCNIFKMTEETSVMKYINTIKLKNIQSLMETKNMKLYDAAQMFGYADPNYVSSLYKKMFGRNITSKPNLSVESLQPSRKQ